MRDEGVVDIRKKKFFIFVERLSCLDLGKSRNNYMWERDILLVDLENNYNWVFILVVKRVEEKS